MASLLAQVISRALSPEQASSRLVDKPALIEAIRSLAGQRIEASGLELHINKPATTAGSSNSLHTTTSAAPVRRL
ncbi:hypothetical protein A6A03_11520 [Chloroflexus islandicus]|uniref:Uncharacterized protein n=1 Tax=Chloroflexus islandicus TaxID=1707952 RepID=A0A178MDT7_9CHLR|nr:hypothetical protein [Chloroflexus islandicus]OAN46929.1 hypothetical protein A6A03_11520 [Chloroflexus islandicus]